MPAPLSAHDLQRAYQVLGVTEAELKSIENAPFLEGEASLKKLKIRVRKNYKKAALELHPDHNQGDPAKSELFLLVTRVSKDLARRQARPGLEESVPRTINYTVNTSAKPVMRVNIRRQSGLSSKGSQEVASRLSKMRP
jgi:hypothetical protein